MCLESFIDHELAAADQERNREVVVDISMKMLMQWEAAVEKGKVHSGHN